MTNRRDRRARRAGRQAGEALAGLAMIAALGTALNGAPRATGTEPSLAGLRLASELMLAVHDPQRQVDIVLERVESSTDDTALVSEIVSALIAVSKHYLSPVIARCSELETSARVEAGSYTEDELFDAAHTFITAITNKETA